MSKIFTWKGRKRRTGTGSLLAPNNDINEATYLRGIISAMAMNAEGVLAVGTFAGDVAFLDPTSPSPLIAALPRPKDAERGITSLHFHPSPFHSNYLLAAARMSTTMHLFDIRNPALPLSILSGRRAMTQQRLDVDVTENGEAWAGGNDGVVKIWEGLGMREGELQPTWEWKAHEDVVGGMGVYPGGAGVVATCSGSRGDEVFSPKRRTHQLEASDDSEESEDSDTTSDSSSTSSTSSSLSSTSSPTSPTDSCLKVWAM